MFSLAVYVTSRYKAYSEFSEYMDGCIKKFIPVGKPSVIISGDYKSNKSGNGLAARYAFENNIPFKRFATLWGKHNPTKPGKRNNAGVASNAQIVKNCNGAVLFWTPTSIAKWDFMSGGCRSFERMCDAGHFARPLIKIKVDIYKSFDEEPLISKKGEEIPSDSGLSSEIGGGSMSPMPSSRGDAASPLPSFSGSGSSAASVGNVPPLPDIGDGSDVSIADDNGGAAPQTAQGVEGNGGQSNTVGNIDGNNVDVSTDINSPITNIPLDLDGNGTPDIEVGAVDTNKDGVPDSIVTPIDADNNGTIDGLKLEPMPTAGQLVSAINKNVAPMPNVQSAQQTSNAKPLEAVDDEKNNQQS